MIEILKHGNSKRKIECGMCHCVFTYTKDDEHSELTREYGDLVPYNAVTCPECGEDIDTVLSDEMEYLI